MASHLRRRADRVKKKVQIRQLLYDLGYRVRPDSGDREEQFPCDLHGDGRDLKFSARVYSDQWYCFGCDKSRDVIETVREKLDLGFSDAIQWLEKKYDLPPLPFESSDYIRPATPQEEVIAGLPGDKTLGDAQR